MQIISLHITTYYQSLQNKNMTWYDMVISQEFEGYHRVMKVRSNITAPQYLRTFLDAIHKLSCSRFKPPGQDSLVISWCHVQTREYMPNGWQPTRNYNCDYNMSPEKSVIFIDILKVMSVSGVAKSMVICCWRCFILTKKTTIFLREAASFGVPNGLGWLYTGPQGHKPGTRRSADLSEIWSRKLCDRILGSIFEFCPFNFPRPRFPSGESRERAVAKDVDSFGFQIQGWLTEYEFHLWKFHVMSFV